MPTDRYTKLVLTVIAGALVALVMQNAIAPAQAQLGGVPLYKGTVPVTIRSIERCASFDPKGNYIGLCQWEQILTNYQIQQR